MNIVVEVSAYYDWEPLPKDIKPTDEDVKALKVKPTLNGEWLMKVTKAVSSHTTIALPESEIADLMAHYQRRGVPKTRASVVAWYLEDVVMPHHAHPQHFSKISVLGEPEIEKFLNTYFNVSAPGA